MKVSVIMPVFNEVETIGEIIQRVRKAPLDGPIELVVVDDGSTDGTREVLARETVGDDLRVVLQPRNRGKGAAIRAGIGHVTGDIVIIQDADLEYDPADIPRVIAPIVDGHADAVFGTRLRGGQPQRAHLFWHYAGNRFLSLATNVLFNTTISDMEVGYKAFRGDLIRSIRLVSDDFQIEPELAAKTLRIPGIRLYEVPISYYGRTYAEGKKITWRDGYRALAALVRFRIEP